MALLLVPNVASAQTSRQKGLWVDVHPGLGLGGSPFGPTFGVRGGLGTWWGNYDADYLLGRSWGVGVAFRADLRTDPDRIRMAPSLELRRTIDLLVLGFRWRVMAGPEWEGDQLGVGARLGGSVKVRPTATWGPTLDAEVGAAWVGERVSPRIGLSLGFEVATPVRRRKKDDAPEEE